MNGAPLPSFPLSGLVTGDWWHWGQLPTNYAHLLFGDKLENLSRVAGLTRVYGSN